MYHQFNVVTSVADVPHAVLVRALEPSEGIDLMRRRRGGMGPGELTSGPGKLCIALGIDRRLDGADLLGDRIWLEAGRHVRPPTSRPAAASASTTRRTGSRAMALLAADNPFVEPRAASARQTRRRNPLRSSAHMGPTTAARTSAHRPATR